MRLRGNVDSGLVATWIAVKMVTCILFFLMTFLWLGRCKWKNLGNGGLCGLSTYGSMNAMELETIEALTSNA